MIQNLWDTEKAFLRGKFIVIQAYLRKKKKLKQPTLHLKEPENKEQKKYQKDWSRNKQRQKKKNRKDQQN